MKTMFKTLRRLAAALAAAAIVSACAESQRPQPTGEAFFRGLNAVSDAPSVNFLIEERGLEAIIYKQSTAAQQFDDFSYNFNFDYIPAGDPLNPRRIVSTFIETERDQDYLLVMAGQFASPEIFVWERADRELDGTETIFQIDFAHASTLTSAVDVFFDVPGTVPVAGNEIGTLNYGEILPPMDFEAGDYELIFTTTGMPGDILYQSDTVAYGALGILTGAVLDADPSIPAPITTARLFNVSGAFSELPDVRYPSTVRFVHASLNEVAVDISLDGDTANPIVTGLAFGQVSGDIEVPSGNSNFTYTDATNPGMIVVDQQITIIPGTRTNQLLNGAAGAALVTNQADDRRPRATNARFRTANMSTNHTSVDIYLVEPGTDINDDDVAPRLFNIVYPLDSVIIQVIEGSYEMWITPVADKTMPLVGPIPYDFANGDTVEIAILDNVDPSIVDVLEYER